MVKGVCVIGVSPTCTSASEYLGRRVLEGWWWLLLVGTISLLRLVRFKLRSLWKNLYRLKEGALVWVSGIMISHERATLVVTLFTPQGLKNSFTELYTFCGTSSDVTRRRTDWYMVWGCT